MADKRSFIGRKLRPNMDLSTSLSELSIGDLIDIISISKGGSAGMPNPDADPPILARNMPKVIKDHKDAREVTGGERIFPEISNIYRSIDQLTDMVLDIEKRVKR